MSSRLVPADALFLHIPKTGGIWVEHALTRSGVPIEPAEVIGGVTHPFRLWCTPVRSAAKLRVGISRPNLVSGDTVVARHGEEIGRGQRQHLGIAERLEHPHLP